MEGMEQLDTVISFRENGRGIARELQRVALRYQSSRSETSAAGATSFLCQRRPATLLSNFTSVRTNKSSTGVNH